MKTGKDLMGGISFGGLRILDAAEVEKRNAERTRKLEEQAAESRRRALAALPDHGVPRKDLALILRAPGGDGAGGGGGGTSALRSTLALRAARQFMAQEDKSILVLGGTPGSGKTFAASWCCAQVPHSARFIDSHRLARLDRYKEMDDLETVALLVLDDLGIEYLDEKGAFLSKVDGLVNARYAAELRTVITTNLPWKAESEKKPDFRRRYGERVADRIREVGEFIGITEPSLRGSR